MYCVVFCLYYDDDFYFSRHTTYSYDAHNLRIIIGNWCPIISQQKSSLLPPPSPHSLPSGPSLPWVLESSISLQQRTNRFMTNFPITVSNEIQISQSFLFLARLLFLQFIFSALFLPVKNLHKFYLYKVDIISLCRNSIMGLGVCKDVCYFDDHHVVWYPVSHVPLSDNSGNLSSPNIFINFEYYKMRKNPSKSYWTILVSTLFFKLDFNSDFYFLLGNKKRLETLFTQPLNSDAVTTNVKWLLVFLQHEYFYEFRNIQDFQFPRKIVARHQLTIGIFYMF